MSEKKKRPVGIRILASVSSIALIVSLVVLLIAGSNVAATLIAIAAFGGLAGPAVVAGDSVIECLSGILELFVEGIAEIFAAIGSIFSGF